MERKSNYNKILFRAGVEINGFLYYSAWNSNGLFKMNKMDNCIQIIDVFETNMLSQLHEFAFEYNNEIWFIPSYICEKIAIYNIDEGRMRYLEFPKYRYACNNRPFMGSCIRYNRIWLFPASIGAVLEIELLTGEMHYHYLMSKNEEEKINKNRFIYSSYFVEENKVYLCPWGEKYITSFNMYDLVVKKNDLGIPKYCYKNIIIMGDDVILFPEKLGEGIIVYNIKEKRQIKKLCIQYNNLCDIVILEGYKAFILPNKAKEMIVIDLEKWEMQFIDNIDIDGDVVWYEVRSILNNKYIIPYNERKDMLYFEENKFKIFNVQHYIDEEINQLLLKLNLNK